jgi:ABC-type phosphate transport system auxiliary subunit
LFGSFTAETSQQGVTKKTVLRAMYEQHALPKSGLANWELELPASVSFDYRPRTCD